MAIVPTNKDEALQWLRKVGDNSIDLTPGYLVITTVIH
jgi:hypothetical protein